MTKNSCGCNNTMEVACKISVFYSEERKHYDELRKELTETMAVEEITSGYTFFPE